MVDEQLECTMESFGVSPWELEVAYGYFDARFTVRQEQIEEPDPDFVSILVINIPLPFSEKFFDWFGFKRWERIKALFKEMKRRRGSKKSIKVRVNFAGRPAISFVADSADRQFFDNSIEKIDFLLEVLPYHLEPKKIPENTSYVTYHYNEKTKRWRLDEVLADGVKHILADDTWRPT